MAQLMTKRIPVSETTWKQLGKVKEAGQTYDELLLDMLQAKHRKDLVAKFDLADKGKGNWTNLEDM
jgi:predicted CopG family antitoxin